MFGRLKGREVAASVTMPKAVAHRPGDVSPDGRSVYAPSSTPEERAELERRWPAGSFPPECFEPITPAPGVIGTLYVPSAPAHRQAARILYVGSGGREITVQPEYLNRTVIFTRRKDGAYREKGLGRNDVREMVVGIDDSTWLAFKQWRRIGDDYAERWPDLKRK